MVFSVAILSLLADEGVPNSARAHARELVADVAKLLLDSPGKPFSIVRQAMGPIHAVGQAITSCRTEGADWIITIGGIGLHRCDYAPEAITPLIDRPNPGIVHEILRATPIPTLSRPVAGAVGDSLVTTFPDEFEAVRAIVTSLLDKNAVLRALDMMKGGSGNLGLVESSLDAVLPQNPTLSAQDQISSLNTFEPLLSTNGAPDPDVVSGTPWSTYDITLEGSNETLEEPPSYEGHSLTATPSGDLYLFGGSGQPNNVYVLSATTLHGPSAHFSLVPTTGHAPSPRMYHQTALFETLLIVWGGREVDSPSMSDTDLHILNLATHVWMTIKAIGAIPKPRSHHTMAVVNAVLYIYGSQNGSSQSLRELWEFDLRNLQLLHGPPRWKLCGEKRYYRDDPHTYFMVPHADHLCILAFTSQYLHIWFADPLNHHPWDYFTSSSGVSALRVDIPADSRITAACVGDRVFIYTEGALQVFGVSTREWLPPPVHSDLAPKLGARVSLTAVGSNVYMLGNMSRDDNNSPPVLRVLNAPLAWTPTNGMRDLDQLLGTLIPS